MYLLMQCRAPEMLALQRVRQEEGEFKANLGYVARPCQMTVGCLWLVGGQGTFQPILKEGREVVGVGWVGWLNH